MKARALFEENDLHFSQLETEGIESVGEVSLRSRSSAWSLGAVLSLTFSAAMSRNSYAGGKSLDVDEVIVNAVW